MKQSADIPQGFYNINKPSGWTSFDVVNKIRNLSGEKKVGHAGTLDPLATGVLVVAVGKPFTKQLTELSGTDKVYNFEITFGVETESHDLEGAVVRKEAPVGITKEKVESVLTQFTGDIEQIPPMYSAIKKNGRRLYEYARKGQTVEMPPRQVTVYSLELLSFSDPSDFTSSEVTSPIRGGNEKSPLIGEMSAPLTEGSLEEYPRVTLRAKVSKGTYVRSLSFDIGVALGSFGVCSKLIREAVSDYKLEDSRTIESFMENSTDE